MFSIYYKNILDALNGVDMSPVFILLLGLLPQKNLALKFLEVPNSADILELSLPGMIEEMKTANEEKIGEKYPLNYLILGLGKNLRV
jgi:hypothetical protein